MGPWDRLKKKTIKARRTPLRQAEPGAPEHRSRRSHRIRSRDQLDLERPLCLGLRIQPERNPRQAGTARHEGLADGMPRFQNESLPCMDRLIRIGPAAAPQRHQKQP